MKKNTVVIVAIVVLVIGLLAGVAIGRASAIKHTFKDDERGYPLRPTLDEKF